MANSVELKLKKQRWKAKALGELKTEGSIKNTGIKTGVELLLSVLVGGAIGSFVGRPSFLLGLGATATGHYLGASWLPPVGIGMMAASNPMGVNTVGGFDLAGGKERLINFKDSLLHRTYLDKIFKKKSGKESEDGTSGFGIVSEQTLNEVERQLVQSAMQFQRQRGQSTAGFEDDMQGVENEPDFSGM